MAENENNKKEKTVDDKIAKANKAASEVDLTKKVKNIIRFGLLGLIILAVIAGGGIYWYQHLNNNMTVYDAKVVSNDVAIKSKADGTITELVVKAGDHVEAGDVIAKITPSITDEQIAQLEQNVDLNKKTLEQLKKGMTTAVTAPAAPAATPSVDYGAQQRLAEAASRLQRMNELYSMGAISAVKRDEAAADYASAKAAASAAPAATQTVPSTPNITTQPADPKLIQQAELQVKQAEAALANAKEDQQATEIVATSAGTVVWADDIAEGTNVKANQQVASIEAADNMWLEAKVTAAQATKIRLGQFVNYTIAGKKLQGSVQDIIDPTVKKDDSDSNISDNNTNNDNAADTTDSDKNSSDNNSNENAASNSNVKADSTDAVPDGYLIVRISLPADMSADIKSGMSATVKFALND